MVPEGEYRDTLASPVLDYAQYTNLLRHFFHLFNSQLNRNLAYNVMSRYKFLPLGKARQGSEAVGPIQCYHVITTLWLPHEH